jgi:hypothetical protein
MATRSTITAKMSDGSFKSVYCHFDGCPSRNGKTLLEHYNTQERVEALLAHGYISVLAPSCDKPKGHTFAKPVEGFTTYFGRDRGEEGCDAHTGATFEEAVADAQEYNYAWDGHEWKVEGLPLAEVLKRENPDAIYD